MLVYKTEYENRCQPRYILVLNLIILMNKDSLFMKSFGRLWLHHFFFFLFFMSSLELIGQGFILHVEPDSLGSSSYFDVSQSFYDEERLAEHLKKKKDSLIQEGFFLASIDSYEMKDSTISMELFVGNRVESIKIKPADSLAQNKYFETKQFKTWEDVQAYKKKIAMHYTEEGFLGVHVKLDQFKQAQTQFEAILSIDKGLQYKLDTIYTTQDAPVSYRYLLQYLNLKEGERLTSQLLKQIKTRSQQSEIFELLEEPRVKLKPWGAASIYLRLKEKKSNAFDFLIGFQPQPNASTNDKKLLLTGQGKLKLINPFGDGREFFMDYKQLQPESPTINVSTFLPTIFQQRFGLRGQFDLAKQDSSFVNLDVKVGVNYQLNDKSHVVFHINSKKSYLQKVDTGQVILTKQLPDELDFSKAFYSAEYRYKNLDHPISTRKGVNLKSSFGVGAFRIQPNSSIVNITSDTFDYNTLFSELLTPFSIYEGELFGQYYLPIGKNATTVVQTKSGAKWSDFYAKNDLFRLGGANSIRGFDEMSYFSTLYSVNTLEYRLLLSRGSFFSVFSDVGYLENKKSNQENLLIGVGTGLDLSTKAGIFTIDMAVGRDRTTPFDFSQSRIHFGYINVF